MLEPPRNQPVAIDEEEEDNMNFLDDKELETEVENFSNEGN